MRQIVHLLDDDQLGGVTRLLASLIDSLSDEATHHRLIVRTQHRLAPSLAGLRPDVIVIHFTASWAKLGFLASLRLRAGGARIILVEHSYTEGYELRRVRQVSRFRAMLRLAYGCADQIVAVSQGQAAWLRKAGLVTADRVTVIPPVLDLTAFASLAPPVPRPGPMRLGAFGRFAPQKGFDTLLAAMRLVPPDFATLDLAGYGPDEAALRHQAQGLDHVRIRGPVDPVAFMAEIDAVAMPSRWEAGGVTCWETRAAGRPIIVADVDGLPEQVSRESGLVVPPEQPEALAKAICGLAADRGAVGRGGTEGAYERVLGRWREVLKGK